MKNNLLIFSSPCDTEEKKEKKEGKESKPEAKLEAKAAEEKAPSADVQVGPKYVGTVLTLSQ